MSRAGPRLPILVLVLVTALVPACAVNGLAFVQDTRVVILQPSENDEATLPLEVRWRARDFDGYFAVFFDSSPMRPDSDLHSVVPERDPCRRQAGCPDAQWLVDHNIYVTKERRVRVDSLPDKRASGRSKDRHQVTIVLLDGEGRRVGESAFVNEFIVDRAEP